MSNLQTIIGSNGAVGSQLAKDLRLYTDHIRLVSRKPIKVNANDQLFAADVLDFAQLTAAVKGSRVVYVTVGFKYSYQVWQYSWIKFMQNLLQVCENEDCALVFFDNVYMYDKNHLNPMTENTPIRATSNKGQVRATVSKMLLDKIRARKIKGLIARSADFYGANIERNSILTELVIKPLSQGKKASWLLNDTVKHAFTYIPDATKAMALLGNSQHAYGQIWHLPTASNPLTGRQWIHAFASALHAPPQYRLLSATMIKIMGVFVPVMSELEEMLYQYDRDYIFDSSLFEQTFHITATPYTAAIEHIVAMQHS